MNPLTEHDVRREIEQIDAAVGSPMQQTRRYLELSRRIRRSMGVLELHLESLSEGEAAEAGRTREQRRAMHLLDEDVRVRAVRTLRASRRRRLGFGYGPQVSPKCVWGRKELSTRD